MRVSNRAWVSALIAAISPRPCFTRASMLAWKALRFARLASLNPSSAAALGPVVSPASARALRRARNASALRTIVSKSGRSASVTRGAQSARSASISARPLRIPAVYFAASARSAEA